MTLVQWDTEEVGAAGGEAGEASSYARTYRRSHPSHPCLVEYSTTGARDVSGGGGGRKEKEGGTRRIRCKRVVVTVSLGVLKVRTIRDTYLCQCRTSRCLLRRLVRAKAGLVVGG